MITKNFVTAGNSIFTLEIPGDWAAQHGCRPHYTFRVRKKDGQRPVFFVSILSGPDNTKDYQYVGILVDGRVKTTAKSRLHQTSTPVRLLNWSLQLVWEGDTSPIEQAGFRLHHEGRCGRCGRRLTVPESIETGLGPECAGKT